MASGVFTGAGVGPPPARPAMPTGLASLAALGGGRRIRVAVLDP